jgi:DNA-binding winged helix-turn-helix (wHTH) protein/dienelactone hydrolase
MGADFTFGVFELDLQARELRKRGVRVSVPGQSLEILIMLLARPGEVVTREEIRERLWPDGTVVEFEHSVNSAVKRLRDRLGDSATTPRFIETLPRIGYRFLMQVEKSDGFITPQHTRLADARQTAGRRDLLRRPSSVGVLSLLVIAAGVFGARQYVRFSQARWAQREALPQVTRLTKEGRPLAALRVLEKAERYAPALPKLIRARDTLTVLPVSIHSTPSGAEISILDYASREDRDPSPWERLGRAPLKAPQIPTGAYRIRAVKAGFEPVERLSEIVPEGGTTLEIQLHTQAATPAGMVWVPAAGRAGFGNAMFPALPAEVPDFWIDRHEVTNSQFKEFVDAGGYQKRQYWKQPFIKDNRILSWEQAMAEFRDASGRPGPATWELGTYPERNGEYPVGGVSWYEAAAYAEFAGKSLPTVYHWFRAGGLGVGTFFEVLRFSNFARQGPAQVETYRGLGPFGTYDMAGNVKEWCWNPVGKFRYILGGGWSDPNYQLSFPDARHPIARAATFGFRCARYVSPVPGALGGEVTFVARDRRGDKPADEGAFRVYTELHSYDRTDLKAAVESSDDSSPYWRKEKVTFQAAYGRERVVAHLYLPKNARPPYQLVVYFPGSTALVAPTIEAFGVGFRPCDQIVRSGRALILPAYKGTLERGPGAYYHWLGQPSLWREMNLQWSKDLGRSLDYLETRKDIDSERLAYVGNSMGAFVGPRLIAVEPRFKVAVLISGGTFEKVPPEVDSLNFAQRVKIPVLMLNGRDDFMFPLESSQLPLYRLLGTPEKDKKHLLYDGGHSISGQLDVAKDMLDWLDRYLGPVNTQR